VCTPSAGADHAPCFPLALTRAPPSPTRGPHAAPARPSPLLPSPRGAGAASYPNDIVVSVAAIDNQGNLAAFKSGRGSNFGARTIHIAAPVRGRAGPSRRPGAARWLSAGPVGAGGGLSHAAGGSEHSALLDEAGAAPGR
jgi:hypothetical protein